MRLATFNVENMFDRAKALNRDDWDEGRPALEAHRELNARFNKRDYSAADKTRILTLLDENGLLRDDEGPYLYLRKIRGRFLKRPNTGQVTVIAEGRSSWIGWVELKTEPVAETATENTARVIDAINADVLGIVEAEDRTTLRLFNKSVIPTVNGNPYHHVMVIDGNDDRGIDVGILTRTKYPTKSIRSHVDDVDDVGTVFSRDCAEYEIALSGGKSLWLLVNHFKSKGFGSQEDNNKKRRRQSVRVRELYEDHLAAGDDYVAVLGDLNDTPESAPLKPLLDSTLRDITLHERCDDGGRPGTHGNSTASSKIDYILLSPALFSRITDAKIERRGMWGGTHGNLWPHFDEIESPADAASDHAALWVDLNI
jgi:endonuclease/exonuclease/phosphatase family metal-dependent hydrolase